MSSITGGCLCGQVQFAVADNFIYAGYCHCSRCRKASGASGTAIGGIRREDFHLIKGEKYIARFGRSEQSTSCFCQQCGSTLYGEKPETGLLHIRYGALDTSPALLPHAHIHVASKADWYQITDALPQFPEFPTG
jgi:hypothetical protein